MINAVRKHRPNLSEIAYEEIKEMILSGELAQGERIVLERMSEQLNLKELERRAYRSTFQDGLWDLYLAGLMASLGILGVIGLRNKESWIWMNGYIVLVGSVFVLFMLGKRYITVPRLGFAKFGPARKRRRLVLVGILSASVLFNVILVLLTSGILKAPAWLQSFSEEMTRRGLMGILVPVFAGLFVTIIMSLIAYFLEFYRGMYIALLFGLSIAIDMIFDLPIAMLVGAVVVAVPGLILLIRFIKQYPIQTRKVEHDSPKAN